jgi:hypothetical protein
LDRVYKRSSKRLKKSIEFFNSYWENNEDRFFNKLESIFGKKVSKYNVLLSNYISGILDWKGTNICINAYSYKNKKENYHVYFLLFEIILSEIFKTMRKNNTEQEFSDRKTWIISELSAFTILGEEWDLFNKVNPRTGYMDIDKLIPEAKEIYENSNNMSGFLEKIISLLKNDNKSL